MIAAHAFHRFIQRKREVTPDDNVVPMVNTKPGRLDVHSIPVARDWRRRPACPGQVRTAAGAPGIIQDGR
jgi:hypothetical protein